MVFLNYNKIFDIDILNLETGCSKIRDDFDRVVDFGLFYQIYAVKGKEISIFLQI